MAINLVDAVMNNLKGPILEQVSGWIGESPQKTEAATKDIVPTILSELAGKVSGAEGEGLLSTIFDKVDDGLLDKLGSILKGGEATKVAKTGGNLLTTIFGDNLVTTLISGISKIAGIGGGSAKSLLGFLAPVIFGALKRLVTKNGLVPSVKWLIGLLGKQKASMTGSLSKGLSDLLGSVSAGAASLVETVTETVTEAEAAVEAAAETAATAAG